MKNSTKIATCCYCHTRSVLELSARDGHELACASCGAPLHNLKWLKQAETKPRPISPRPVPQLNRFVQSSKKRKSKKRKSGWSRVIKEVWDEIEDIFD